MSTQPPPNQPAPLVVPPKTPEQEEIRIVSHSNLFYWWPVWAVGYLMAIFTLFENHRLAFVPGDAKVEQNVGKGDAKVYEFTFKKDVPRTLGDAVEASKGDHDAFPVRISEHKNYGAIWAVTLLLVIIITNAPLRGMWSVLVIVVVILGSIILALAGWWDKIFDVLGRWNGVHIDAGGYLFTSTVLFVCWLVSFLFLDQQIYMVFTPGQLKVRLEIGGGETAYDTMGMTISKQRSDLFRHWILGLGSGDLVVNTSGAQVHHFDLPNVLFVGKKVQQIEEMLREKQVVRG